MLGDTMVVLMDNEWAALLVAETVDQWDNRAVAELVSS